MKELTSEQEEKSEETSKDIKYKKLPVASHIPEGVKLAKHSFITAPSGLSVKEMGVSLLIFALIIAAVTYGISYMVLPTDAQEQKIIKDSQFELVKYQQENMEYLFISNDTLFNISLDELCLKRGELE